MRSPEIARFLSLSLPHTHTIPVSLCSTHPPLALRCKRRSALTLLRLLVLLLLYPLVLLPSSLLPARVLRWERVQGPPPLSHPDTQHWPTVILLLGWGSCFWPGRFTFLPTPAQVAVGAAAGERLLQQSTESQVPESVARLSHCQRDQGQHRGVQGWWLGAALAQECRRPPERARACMSSLEVHVERAHPGHPPHQDVCGCAPST